MKISIITVTYNSGATLINTIQSILRQSYSNYEHIIIDGGSSDNTLAIIQSYESFYEGRLKWISESDRGIYDAMNKGISKASGEIIGILNSDDYYSSEDILSTISTAFQNTNIDACYGDVQYVDQTDTSKKIRYYSSKIFRPWLMRFGFMPAHPSFYCKKSIYDKYKLDEGKNNLATSRYFNTSYKIAADFENLLRIIYIGKIKTVYLNKCFVTMRNGGASSSGISSHKQINKDHLRALKENGVYSNICLLSLRYIYKIGELIISKLR